MDITSLINHPERLNKETLYDLRSLLALYPYYQPARILLLKNLFLLHDSTFDEELRRAAVYITDRKILFDLVEGVHYQLLTKSDNIDKAPKKKIREEEINDRTTSLIDNFLEQIPNDNEDNPKTLNAGRKPTTADATVDYVAYLLESESASSKNEEQQLKGQELIDNFINLDGGKITLQDETEYSPNVEENEESEEEHEETGYFTETLARIYIRQGRYSKALEIITRLNLDYPKKNRYFADQIRFLEKLIIINNKK